jgi:uncharacterized membrane protein
MHPLILAVLFMFVAILAYAANNGEWPEWANVLMVALIGYLLGENNRLANALQQLRAAMAQDWEQRHLASKEKPPEKPATPAVEVAPPPVMLPPEPMPPKPMVVEPPPLPKPVWQETVQPEWKPKTRVAYQPQQADSPSWLMDTLAGYFTGGNLFVRIGILVLFFGVSFLIKLVAERGMFPIEFRLAGIAVGAAVLLGLGWRWRHSKTSYALLLQGAAVGILYLDVFATFSLYHLIPPLPAFVLLFAVSMLAAALAVLQNASSLAVLGFSGGFLAPILTSTGSDNYVGLFGYYAVLNVAIALIAWFRAWRPLNLLGFGFTFVVASLWGADSYTPEKFTTTEPFLMFFFLLYVGIAVLSALRQPPKLKGYVDGTLLFGVPLAASGLQYHMLKDTEYGVAISAFAMGLLYLLLSRVVWQRRGETLGLLAEAFLALGITFTSLAIPFALSESHTAAAWAVEGLGMIWLGSRQIRFSVRIFGLLLQFGAAMFVAYDVLEIQTLESFRALPAFINGTFISTNLMAVAGVGTAWLLSRDFIGRRALEQMLSPLFLLWGLGWLYGGFMAECLFHLDTDWLFTYLLLLSSAVSLGFGWWALHSRWQQALRVALALLPVMLLLFLPVVEQPSANGGWLAWPLAFTVLYLLFFWLDKTPEASLYPFWHSGAFLLLVTWVTCEGMYHLERPFADAGFVTDVWLALPALGAWWWVGKANHWPFALHKDAYQRQAGWILAACLLLWVLVAVVSRQAVNPLPWLPLLNPFDGLAVIILLSLFAGWPDDKGIFPAQVDSQYRWSAVAALLFLWLNTTLFRVAHHGWGIPYRLDDLLDNSSVQTALSILWALTGVLMTVFSSKRQWRKLWLAGSLLLGIVVLKLFLVDLSQLGSIARVLSFISVGILLISIGYFAPLPAGGQSQETEGHEGDG